MFVYKHINKNPLNTLPSITRIFLAFQFQRMFIMLVCTNVDLLLNVLAFRFAYVCNQKLSTATVAAGCLLRPFGKKQKRRNKI